MESLEAELARARDLDADALADAIESIGFECTRCGACCKADDEAHTATVFPDEVRDVKRDGEYDHRNGDAAPSTSSESSLEWRDVARPTPFGLDESGHGETFEWALQTDDCGDCRFYEESGETGGCSIYGDRPLICRTYPFSVALGGTSQPLGEAVDREGMVRAHECEGLGRDISRADAEALATTLKERAVRELAEAIAVRDAYEPVEVDAGEIVVHDSEGPKRPNGSPYESA